MSESTPVPREEMSNLDWLARNMHEFPAGQEFAWISMDVYFSPVAPLSGNYFTKQQWLARRTELQNKPNWEDAPEWASTLTQVSSGFWFWVEKVPSLAKLVLDDLTSYGELMSQCHGEILGDWRDTLEKRPEAEPEISYNLNCEGFVPFVSVEDANPKFPRDVDYVGKINAATAKQPSITPSKYTKTIHGVSVDVYDVLQTWGVSNPALQHLIKKALQCGQRGHKDNAQDLQDIIDSAIRAKELEC